MKSDFKNLKEIIPGHPIFLYGNLKQTFSAFCDFVFDKLQTVERHFCTVAEVTKIVNAQNDLFNTNTICLCIQNVEDNHLAKIEGMLYDPRYLFIMNSGDYMKSKKVTEYFTNDPKSIALPSFKNNLTLNSFCKMMLPNIDAQLYPAIIELINNTDEDFHSLFRKLQLLLEDNGNLLKEYITYKQSYFSDLSSISLIRYFLQNLIRTKFSAKSDETSNTEDITNLIQCETRVKFGEELPRSFIESYGNPMKPN